MLALILTICTISCTSLDDAVLEYQVRTNEDVLTTASIDTIIAFNPETMKETVQYVTRNENAKTTASIDTIITFNPETMEETIQIVRNN